MCDVELAELQAAVDKVKAKWPANQNRFAALKADIREVLDALEYGTSPNSAALARLCELVGRPYLRRFSWSK